MADLRCCFLLGPCLRLLLLTRGQQRGFCDGVRNEVSILFVILTKSLHEWEAQLPLLRCLCLFPRAWPWPCRHFMHISILSAGHEPGEAGWGWMLLCHKSDPALISWVGNSSQEVLIFRGEAMWIKARCTLQGGLACSRRVFLWAGVTGHLSPDRMGLSMKQCNLQVRKPSVCTGGLGCVLHKG